jgi:type I restriction enzyme S subunit
MNTKLGPYPKYKDSGIPWLGQIPAHWDVRRNGRLFAQRNETGFGELPILEVSLRTGVRVRDMDNLKRKQVMSDAEKYKRAAKGDIAYNMMRMWQGALGTAPVDGLVSPAYVVARPFEETNPYYFSYLFRTEGYKAEVDGYSRGIVKDRNRLYWQDFKRMPSCFPPIEEQSVIVQFLDANALLIRKLIRNRRQLIKTIGEQKRAFISRAISRGLNHQAPTKPSGIEWLGDIPSHWSVMPMKRFATINPARSEFSQMRASPEQVTFLPMEKVSASGHADYSLILKQAIAYLSESDFRSAAATEPAGLV